jgi:hypothetical protein
MPVGLAVLHLGYVMLSHLYSSRLAEAKAPMKRSIEHAHHTPARDLAMLRADTQPCHLKK